MKYKVVYNASYGGFNLSELANELLASRGVEDKYFQCDFAKNRHHAELVAVVEILGAKASGQHSKLQITQVEGPYIVHEYDGFEEVVQPNDISWCDPTCLHDC